MDNPLLNIIAFKPRPSAPAPLQQWLCNCGCLTFYAYDDGRLICAQCKTHQSLVLEAPVVPPDGFSPTTPDAS